jgi:Na+/melibiose symporter-like transporter
MWFQKHPNLTVFFSWISSSIILYASSYLIKDANSQAWWFILALCVLLVWGTLAWSLRVKHRSLFNLFYFFVPALGFFIIWMMSDNSQPKKDDSQY